MKHSCGYPTTEGPCPVQPRKGKLCAEHARLASKHPSAPKMELTAIQTKPPTLHELFSGDTEWIPTLEPEEVKEYAALIADPPAAMRNLFDRELDRWDTAMLVGMSSNTKFAQAARIAMHWSELFRQEDDHYFPSALHESGMYEQVTGYTREQVREYMQHLHDAILTTDEDYRMEDPSETTEKLIERFANVSVYDLDEYEIIMSLAETRIDSGIDTFVWE